MNITLEMLKEKLAEMVENAKGYYRPLSAKEERQIKLLEDLISVLEY